MIIFITITLNYRIYYLPLNQISFLSLFSWFIWSIFLCFPILLDSLYFYVLNETAISSSLKGVVLCRQWSILFNHALVLGCLSSVSPIGLFSWKTHCPLTVRAWHSIVWAVCFCWLWWGKKGYPSAYTPPVAWSQQQCRGALASRLEWECKLVSVRTGNSEGEGELKNGA